MKYMILVSTVAVLAFLTTCNPLQIQNNNYNYKNYPLPSGWSIYINGDGDLAFSLKANAGIGTSMLYIYSGDVLKGKSIYSDTENDA